MAARLCAPLYLRIRVLFVLVFLSYPSFPSFFVILIILLYLRPCVRVASTSSSVRVWASLGILHRPFLSRTASLFRAFIYINFVDFLLFDGFGASVKRRKYEIIMIIMSHFARNNMVEARAIRRANNVGCYRLDASRSYPWIRPRSFLRLILFLGHFVSFPSPLPLSPVSFAFRCCAAAIPAIFCRSYRVFARSFLVSLDRQTVEGLSLSIPGKKPGQRKCPQKSGLTRR